MRITLREALILQALPPSYPIQGSRSKAFEQIGNAVPPLLATHVLAMLTGCAIAADERPEHVA